MVFLKRPGMHRGSESYNKVVRAAAEQLDHLHRLLAGETGAWNDFVGEYAALILSAVRVVLNRRGAGDEELARDLSQDVFMKLIRDDFRLLRRFDGTRAGLGTYLAVIARSHTLDALKKRRVQTDPLPEEIGTLPPEHELEPGDLLAAVPSGLLSERQDQVIRLLFYEELSVNEAAVVLGVEAQTVRSQKHRALTKLRAYFNGRSPAEDLE